MVDVRPTNAKLVDRARRIVVAATSCSASTAADALDAAEGHAKTAIVMILTGCDGEEAVRRLDAAGGFVRAAIAAH
jgi:N-acetylmuramic acid 6-phosphate etherase